MKKSTKKLMMALGIILIFGLSSISFVATSFFGGQQQQQQFQQLSSPIVDGEVDLLTENTYVENGFTWIKYYYTETDSEFMPFVESLPQAFPANPGQNQIIVQKINEKYLNETNYVVITSPAGQESFSPDKNMTVNALCRLLTIAPLECALRNFNGTL